MWSDKEGRVRGHGGGKVVVNREQGVHKSYVMLYFFDSVVLNILNI